jgi:hypothetical protein
VGVFLVDEPNSSTYSEEETPEAFIEKKVLKLRNPLISRRQLRV